MRVLVAHASKQGGTAELAGWIGESLERSGVQADVIPASEVKDVEPYDAVILGGALYVFRWHSDARRFAKRHTAALRDKPVWLFSSGPLDDSATEKEIPPVRSARKAMARVGARGHITFGGRMLPGSKSALPVGDWRDRSQVDAWVEEIVRTLVGSKSPDEVSG
ncbi:MAG: flavodoxin domain-containing protein [Acidimicrobiia bacterium]|jgi:menaquinone-dependent protoporphyrinogen oxidase